MTAYHGGKQRFGKAIASCMKDYIGSDTQFLGYCEPFCGMLGVYQHMLYLNLKSYLAGDINEAVINMWQASQNGWIPKSTCSEDEFLDFKKRKCVSPESGFFGHQLSFGGKFLECYSPKYGKPADCSKQAIKVASIGNSAKDVKFNCDVYTQYSHLKGFVMYCDPPYENTQHRWKFDHSEFVEWCIMMSKHNMVFVSGFTKPCQIVEIVFKSSLKPQTTNGNPVLGVEHLYLYPRGIYDAIM